MERVKDDAARPRVQEMMQRIRNSSGAAAAKAKAEEAFEKYEATFSVTVAISAAKVGGVRRRLIGKKKPGALFSAVARAHKQESRRLQSKSSLFTYNLDFFGRKLRAVLQARNAKFKGGTSATNMYAWSKYLYGVPFVATVDFDAPDAYLVDENSQWQSRWLMKNTERVCLSQGETFYDQAKLPKRKLHNCFSLFAATLKKRRASVQL